MNIDWDKFEIRETWREVERIKEWSYLKWVLTGLIIAIIIYCVVTFAFMAVI